MITAKIPQIVYVSLILLCFLAKNPCVSLRSGFSFFFKINFNRRQISHSKFLTQSINVLLVTTRVVDKIFFFRTEQDANKRAMRYKKRAINSRFWFNKFYFLFRFQLICLRRTFVLSRAEIFHFSFTEKICSFCFDFSSFSSLISK